MKNFFWDSENDEPRRGNIILTIIVGVILLVVLLAANPFYVVNATERGLLFNWGAIQENVIPPGLHMRAPFVQHVEKISILPMEVVANIPDGKDGAITEDNQTVGVDVVAFYRYDESQLVQMYRSVGESRARSLVQTSVIESVKNTIGTYSIFDVASSQDEIVATSLAGLRKRMAEYPVVITDLRILNWDWNEEYEAQVKETMKRSEQVKQKKQELLIAEEEAQKMVKQAEAAKSANILAAQGEFEAAKLRADARAEVGRGEKEYNQAIASTLDIQIKLKELEIEKIKAEAWDGKYVPENHYGPIPIQSDGRLLGK